MQSSIDSLRANFLRLYGGSIAMPNIEYFTNESVVYKNAYSTAAATRRPGGKAQSNNRAKKIAAGLREAIQKHISRKPPNRLPDDLDTEHKSQIDNDIEETEEVKRRLHALGYLGD